MIDFYTFWVAEVCGTPELSLFVTALIFTIIGIFGRMSYLLLGTLLILYFITFGAVFYGLIIWLPLLIVSALYFAFNLVKWMSRE